MSFAYKKQRVEIWGVMNVTPDSFSDGGQLVDPKSLTDRLIQWAPHVDAVDIGAESTAPHNRALSAQEERARLEMILAPMLSHWPRHLTLSLDTYHFETIEWLASTLSKDIRLVWNDVSGMADESVWRVLEANPQMRYVLCFNQVPSREQTQEHMNFVQTGSVVKSAKDFFVTNFEQFLKRNLFSRVIADPCFGFAKSREQNQFLLSQLPALMEELACPVWMWGISRKSFLRFPSDANPRDPSVQQELDTLATIWAGEALDRLSNPHTIVLRTHAPFASKALSGWGQLKEQWNLKS